MPTNGEIVLEVMRSRSSYRGRYKDICVPKDDLIKIMEAGLSAPSGCNKQTTSLIAVDDALLLAELKRLINPPICQTAPVMICVLAQDIIAYRDRCYSIQDYSAAIENMLLAIHALGYASCWYEGHITDDDDIAAKLAERLRVPRDYRLVCILPVGVAMDEARHVAKKKFSDRAWFNEMFCP